MNGMSATGLASLDSASQYEASGISVIAVISLMTSGQDMIRRLGRGLSRPSSSIRRATAEDREFLTDMLLEAVNWSPEWKPKSRRRVLSDPRTAHYIAGWPRDTGLGVIAEAGSQPAGGAWNRFFPADDPAYGFTSPDVPELTIGVAATWRGRGVGRTLLRAIAESAAEAGIGRHHDQEPRTRTAHPAHTAKPPDRTLRIVVLTL
jgi:GNAT superfamily N-acetyltransferase